MGSASDSWGISETQDNDDYDKMQQKLVAQADCVKKTIHQGFDGVKWHDTLGNIISFFNVSKIKSKFPAYKQGTFLDELICKFEELFFKEYMAAYGEWDRAIENFCGEHSIPIMTRKVIMCGFSPNQSVMIHKMRRRPIWKSERTKR